MKAGMICLVAAVLLPAQLQLPFPGRGKKASQKKEILQQFTGRVQSVEPEALTITATDTRVVTFKCTKETTYLQDEKPIQRTVLKAGDEIEIEARSDDQGFFQAVHVTLVKAAQPPPPAPRETAEEPRRESATTVNERPAEADEERPVLRRGKPAPRPRKPEEEEPQAVQTATAPVPETPDEPHPDDVFLEKARASAMEFTESLPNYIVRQMTTRYDGQGRPIDWRPLDIVTASVLYENGKETYHDIKVNNKPVKKGMEEIEGSRSWGEFGSTLRDLFSPASAAVFRQRNESTASGRPAVRYDFNVKQPNSHWKTQLGGQWVTPAYRGSVWIDKKTSRVMRIEMQARDVPDEFPLDTIEWVVEYAFVRIGGPEFLVPVHAENLSCWRGSTRCARNSLDFRNYRRFTSESQILTTDSDITYETEPEKKPK